MKRRTFLKTVTAAGISFPFLSFGKATPVVSQPKDDLEEFFQFCENRKISTLHSSTTGWEDRPFKLTVGQKEIARAIHRHKYIFVIKGRQIGFSTLTAAYCAWRWTKDPKNVHISGASCNFYSMVEWNKRLVTFAPNFPYKGGYNTVFLEHSSWPTLGKNNISVLDELNYEDSFEEYLEQLYTEYDEGYTYSQPCDGKLIVGGSPDHFDRLHKAANDRKKYPKFVMMREPVTHFPELWSTTRLQDCLLNGCNEKELLL